MMINITLVKVNPVMEWYIDDHGTMQIVCNVHLYATKESVWLLVIHCIIEVLVARASGVKDEDIASFNRTYLESGSMHFSSSAHPNSPLYHAHSVSRTVIDLMRLIARF